MKTAKSLFSSLVLGIGLTLGISTVAIAYPKNHNVRRSEVRVVYPGRYSNLTPRYYRNSSRYNSRYNRNYDRNYYGRRRNYHDGYYRDCRDGRRARGRGRRARRNVRIIGVPAYRNNLAFPNYIKVRTVR